ncbi:thrombomodulin-like [Bufo bufo]|uniref:thrombomodulin-like n=1 Tax=Bufo bufo TaxID=8384 RepID=UPI001ABE6509|nr:thrombomodulin-like [Bufo bufo]
MQLYHFTWRALLLAQVAQVALQEELVPEFLCSDNKCYSVLWDKKRFAKSRGACTEKKGHGDLMTVQSSWQAEAIHELMAQGQKNDTRVWIGLELKDGCTDLQLPLRGYTWVTGDSHTDYTNWQKEEQKCGAHCVTVRKDGTWEEIPCNSKADGYLCEISYSSPCPSLQLPFSYSATYYHLDLGFASTGGTVFPPGTKANIYTSPDNIQLFCEEKADGTMAWSSDSPGAWSCLILNGGCEHECVEESDTAQCKCPSGSELKADHRSCTNPCDPSPCSQQCVLVSDPPGVLCMCSEGFTLRGDGRTCEDIDDCAANPNICEHHCTNTIGGFDCGCKPGFKKQVCDAQDGCATDCQDVDECDTSMCEHNCENFPGGYRCVCRKGFVIDENNRNKCKPFCNTSKCLADCTSRSCRCPEGYILETEDGADVCTDVDECDTSPCDSLLCINTFGSFKCTCPQGHAIYNGVCIRPTEAPSDISPPTSRPEDVYSLQPTIMWGICSGILSMLIVLLVMLCHRRRRHYIYQHDLDYNYKNNDKNVVLKKIMMEPQWRL